MPDTQFDKELIFVIEDAISDTFRQKAIALLILSSVSIGYMIELRIFAHLAMTWLFRAGLFYFFLSQIAVLVSYMVSGRGLKYQMDFIGSGRTDIQMDIRAQKYGDWVTFCNGISFAAFILGMMLLLCYFCK